MNDPQRPKKVNMINFIYVTARVLCVLSVVGIVASTSSFARLPKGIAVQEQTSKVLSFTYVPKILRWDTVNTFNSATIRPVIDGAQIRASSDGSIVQWIVTVDCIVPSPLGFRVDRSDFRTLTLASSLPFTVEHLADRMRAQMPSPLSQRVTVTYDGIAGDRHIARISIVVASRENGRTTITRSADVRLTFAGGIASAGRAPSALGVINPLAPWLTAPSVYSKKNESVQNTESFENMFRMSIDREGMYRLTADQLRSAGVPTDAEAARTIRVFGRGGLELPEEVDSAMTSMLREQPITVRTNGDGSVRDVIFYASATTGWNRDKSTIRHYIHHYAKTSTCYLTYGGIDGLRASPRAASAAEATIRPTIVTGRVFNEDEIASPYSSGSGRRWLGRTIENGGSIVMNTILPGLVRTGAVEYRYVVAHRGGVTGAMTVTENGTFVAQTSIRAVPKYMDAYTTFGKGVIDAQTLPADARSVLRLSYSSTDKSTSGMLDWFEIHYPRQMQASESEFEFWTVSGAGVHEYAVNGFSGDLFGVDVTDRTRPQMVENVSAIGGMFVIRESIDSSIARRYFLSSNLRSTTLSRITFPHLHARPRAASLLVITDPSLQPSAQRYADYRISMNKISARVITTDEIYSEFSYGMQDPTAIRDFIAMAYAAWTPRPTAVLFWGDGHFDYKNISTSVPNYVIPYESLDPDDQDYGLVTYTTDDYYVRVAGEDNRPELAIGRMPITSNQIGDRITSKIRLYENSASTDDWRTRITLVADDGQQGDGLSDGDTHLDQSEILAREYTPAEFQIRKIYMVEYPTENVARGRRKPTVTQDMVSTLNTSGSLILNWIGHGNPRVWAHEGIFARETTPSLLSNATKPFFLTAATCDFARWDMTETMSGAEDLLLLETGGAIGVFSAARVVFSLANAELNQEFYSDLFTRGVSGEYPTLGEAMYSVKQKYNGNNDEKFHLLGDPTMRILVPEQTVRFTKINGVDVTQAGQAVTIAALSTVVVEGDLTRAQQTATDVSFEGNVTISLLDANRTLTVVDTDIYRTVNTFTKSGPALCRGSFKVENGRFTGTFVVPKDISFSSQAAGLYGYAASNDQRYAMGVTDRVVVDGVTSISDPETSGPEMKIFLDSRNFVPGGITRPSPILIVDLHDATGINTTGVGIGHDIEATFDEGRLIEILTPSFTTSLSNSRAGSAQKQIFGLASGLHSVRVQAWDVLNNVSSASTTFRIVESPDGIAAENLSNFPNPFTTSTTIRYTHASPRPFNATLLIYDVRGELVAESPMRVTDMQTAEVVWNGRDNAGSLVGSGMYQAVVRLVDELGSVSFVSGKLSLVH